MANDLYLLEQGLPVAAEAVNAGELAGLPGWSATDELFSAANGVVLAGAGQAAAIAPPVHLPGPGYICGQVTSTFDVAWELLKHDLLPVWGFVLAAEQKSGRGQLRREWRSDPGNIYLTVRLPSELSVSAGALLTAHLLRRALHEAYRADVLIKWPNDLLYAGRKVGGILLEERGAVLLAGVGINLLHAPQQEQLRADGRGKPFPAGVLPLPGLSGTKSNPLILNAVMALVKEISFWYEKELSPLAPTRWAALAEGGLACKGQPVTVHEPRFAQAEESLHRVSTITGVIAGLGPDGELRLLTSSGREHFLHSGTVSLEVD